MRNLFLKPFCLLFGMLILVSSCATTEDLTEEQLTVTETFNYQKFYEDYKDEIHNLNREDFTGLNINLRILALQDFSIEKKLEWWNDKLDNTLKSNSFSDEQKDFITKSKEMLTPNLYEIENEEKYNVAEFVEVNAYKVGIDDGLMIKIFMALNDLDENMNLTNDAANSNITTIKTAKAMNLKNETIQNYFNKPEDPISNVGNCQNYSCFFCSIGGNCDCTTDCMSVPNACGVFSAFTCDAICCPSY